MSSQQGYELYDSCSILGTGMEVRHHRAWNTPRFLAKILVVLSQGEDGEA